jgi:hypothetical protein
MKLINVVLIILALGLIIVPRIKQSGPDNPPSPKPTETFGFEVSIPALKMDKQTSLCVAGLSDAIADIVEKDAKSSMPKYNYVVNVFDLRNAATSVALDGKEIKDTYPEFPKTVGPVFTQLGTGSEPLTPEKRTKTVNIFRAISYGLRQ